MQRYLYRSSAQALAGTITKPFSDVMQVQAAADLPPTGGFGSARVERYRFRDIVSFELATSVVIGSTSEEDGRKVHNSLATVTVEGLNILGVVTADRVVARLVAGQPDDKPELPIFPVGSHFVNLRVAGVLVDLKPHPELISTGTMDDIHEKCRKSRVPVLDPDGNAYDFQTPLGGRAKYAAGAPSATFPDRQILTSIFQPLAGAHPLANPKSACRIDVPGFGKIHLGEFFVTRQSRRLSMLRLELGCPVEGMIEAVVAGGNGSTYP